MPVDPDSLPVPCVQFTFNVRKSASKTTTLINLLEMRIQEFDLQVEESLIWTILEFIGQIKWGKPETGSVASLDVPLSSVLDLPKVTYSKLYFQALKLDPISINISLELDKLASGSDKSTRNSSISFNPFVVLLRIAGTTLSSLDRAPLHINALVLQHAFGNTALFLNTLSNHFINQALQQSYKVLGSFEVLGNPVATISKLGSGVQDLFYEPLRGLTESPLAFGRGVLRGGSSLVRNSMAGMCIITKFSFCDVQESWHSCMCLH